jgi:hypothetical protein
MLQGHPTHFLCGLHKSSTIRFTNSVFAGINLHGFNIPLFDTKSKNIIAAFVGGWFGYGLGMGAKK